jgi:ABC-type sugar transport system permease subunit
MRPQGQRSARLCGCLPLTQPYNRDILVMNASSASVRADLSAVPSWLIPMTLAANAVIALACIAQSAAILALPDFGGLGDPVQGFAAVVAVLPALACAYFSAGLLLRRPRSSLLVPSLADTRYGLMFFYFLAAALSFVYVIWRSGVFNGLEFVVTGFMQNAWLAFVFMGAYVIFWIGSRAESALVRRTGLLVGLVGVVILLLSANFLQGVVDLLASYRDLDVLVGTISGVAASLLCYAYLSRGAEFGETAQQRQAWQGWLMLAPNILGFMIFFAGPLLLSLYLSFTDDTVGREPRVIWLQNYTDILSFELKTQPITEPAQRALSFGFRVLATFDMGETRLVWGAKDPEFWLSLRNTLVFCLMLLPLSIIPALLLSIILNTALPGMKFYRAVFFLPSVAAVVGTALIWRWLYSPNIGYYNYAITSIITWFNTTFGTSINDPQIAWLTDPNVVLISIVLLAAWQIMGNNTVLFLAGLQGIPRELYEAAMIDGANAWRSFWNVTLPLLRPTMFFVVITVMVTGLQVFNEPYALFPSRPIPIQAQTSVFYLYQQGFFRFQFGYASAIAWFLFVIIFTLTFIQFRLQREDR